jgi:hypothetical protein
MQSDEAIQAKGSEGEKPEKEEPNNSSGEPQEKKSKTRN